MPAVLVYHIDAIDDYKRLRHGILSKTIGKGCFCNLGGHLEGHLEGHLDMVLCAFRWGFGG